MRIVTGSVKGLKLKAPKGFSTRPTSDRVKESVFNILNGMINFSEVDNVLDIFAGTGSLGIEALSRGASSAVFIDFATTEIISENIKRAKFENVTKIFRGDFVKVLKKISAQDLKFDLIFADPPYKKNLANITLELIAELELLNTGGLIVVEHGIDENLDTKIVEKIRKIDYGHTTSVEILTVNGSD